MITEACRGSFHDLRLTLNGIEVMSNLYVILFALFAAIAIIVVFTAKLKVHPFFALTIACAIVGVLTPLSLSETLSAMQAGFGHVIQSLGFIIVLGTALGVLLERNGSTQALASAVIKLAGPRNTAAALSSTGFLVGLPIFCDSGFIVLNGLNLKLAKRTAMSLMMTTTCLATGLYSVHCLVPPHPGVTAAASTIGADLGMLTALGIVIAIPGAVVAYYWAKYSTAISDDAHVKPDLISEDETRSKPVPFLLALLPVVVPVLLITLRSLYSDLAALKLLGEPIIALAVGVVLALLVSAFRGITTITKDLHNAAEKSGSILIIIGAGGAFGGVLKATHLEQELGAFLPLETMGLFFPFLVTSLLKTAQGSSTVAIITAASMTAPLLPALGLDSADGRILCVLAMGAGSMMISHANDAYFWVIAKFADLPTSKMFRVYSVATVLMGLTSLAMVYLISLFL
jgi:gluconate:H+ symporter, GntP family